MAHYRVILAEKTRPFTVQSFECKCNTRLEFYDYCAKKVVQNGDMEVVACYQKRWFKHAWNWIAVRTYDVDWHRRLTVMETSQLKLDL